MTPLACRAAPAPAAAQARSSQNRFVECSSLLIGPSDCPSTNVERVQAQKFFTPQLISKFDKRINFKDF
jgi:hypothetical protein